MYAPEKMPEHFRAWRIRTSFMQRLPGVTSQHQWYMPLYPLAFENFDLSKYKVVLSSSSAFAKGVITEATALHVCYCHSPMRFAWNYYDYIEGERWAKYARVVLPVVMTYVRLWDEVSSRRVDAFLANSRVVARRIRKRYGQAIHHHQPARRHEAVQAARGRQSRRLLSGSVAHHPLQAARYSRSMPSPG